MRSRMPLGNFLVAYLRMIGVRHVFGIPGDLVINLFMKFGRTRGLHVVTLSHEPSVGFAADGYARSTGGLGVVCVTYGAGGFNVINPIAGAFAERVPLLVLSGGPGEDEYRVGTLIHHQARAIESQVNMFREVTCTARVISDPRTAADEIDEVVRAMWLHRQPGYLEIHRDMVTQSIAVPRRLIEWDGRLPRPVSDPRKVAEAADEAAAWLNRAKRPMVIVGIEPYRFGAKRDTVELVDRLGCACAASVLAKGAFPMEHPQYMGVYAGPMSPPAVRRRAKDADVVLSLGTLLTDIELGQQSPEIPRHKSMWTIGNKVRIKFHNYSRVSERDFIQAVLKRPLKRHPERVAYHDNLPKDVQHAGPPLNMAPLLAAINDFVASHPRTAVIVDSGDSLFGGIELKVPSTGLYMAQGFYASMGFSIPGALGAQLGTGLRPLILCGDGSFQMTGGEISHAVRLGLNPIVVLLNNHGWGIFRPLTTQKRLLDLPDWPYAKLAELWGGRGVRAATVPVLAQALEAAAAEERFVLIEAMVNPADLSPVSRRYIETAGKRARLTA
ncbi:MAG: thiamine pyrophosphate-binding protein [Nitrospirota bacterium]